MSASLKFRIFLLTALTAFRESSAQNLVPNPGFEKFKLVPNTVCIKAADFSAYIQNWTLPTNGTSDYFNTRPGEVCSQYDNFIGVQQPQEGKAYCGMHVYTEQSEYREYLQVKLQQPLIAGQQYVLTFYVSLADASSDAVNRLGAGFYGKAIKQHDDGYIPGGAMTETPDSVFFDNKTGWTQVRLLYTAKGHERFLVIGNFRSSDETQCKKTTVETKYYPRKSAYYYIDNVCLLPVVDGKNDCPCADTIRPPATVDTVKPAPVPVNVPVVFHGVNFDFDKATLQPESYPALDSLANFLLENPEYTIAISGHTDNAGNETHNLELSEARAKAVADYFISKGIPADRISYKGYGSSRPVAYNSTPEGRAQNRRVEYVLTKK